ncbi:hypothetical protein T01_469 [Trichinella spiralis]|uniref:Secreted protein n=1 Tax=Trichinella spiralis TaxID=6334 RepID=A0A0V1AJ09_TRISP|nr:hypothetical protein T01_469 [Trichinella spiralis]
MAAATQVALIHVHLVWNCTAAILSSLCIFPKGNIRRSCRECNIRPTRDERWCKPAIACLAIQNHLQIHIESTWDANYTIKS